MNPHLTSQELVDALQGQFASSRRERHVESCDRCRSELSELRGILAHVDAAADVPEPSPLFWDHFSQRVHAATREIPAVRQASWSPGWRPIAGLAAVLVVALLAVAVQRPRVPGTDRAAGIDALTPAAPVAVADDESLSVVAQIASSISFEDLQQAARPTPDATDAMVAQLSPRERAELVRLIRAEKGSTE